MKDKKLGAEKLNEIFVSPVASYVKCWGHSDGRMCEDFRRHFR